MHFYFYHIFSKDYSYQIIKAYIQHRHMSCAHLAINSKDPHFLSPYLQKTTWMCLYDGCYKIKKNMTREQLIEYGEKMQVEHRVIINCQTLEIYCAICHQQLFDEVEEQDSRESPLKIKKNKRISLVHIRQYLMVPAENDGSLYSSNTQYPPSFQKQKKGLCGLKNNTLTSYLNSVIHLLAYIPTMRDIAESVELEKIDNRFVQMLFESIRMIWTGQHRIYNVNGLQGKIIAEDGAFRSYTRKTPQQVLYFFLKNMLDQFYFQELPCEGGSMLTQPYDEWSTPNPKNYNLVKELFGGQCILQRQCHKCKHFTTHTNKFQCLKVSYENTYDMTFKGSLLGLIEEALHWKNSHSSIYQRLQNNKLTCEKCSQKIKEVNSFVNLPNNLILELGEDINGLNIVLPDEIEVANAKKNQNNVTALYEYIGCISRVHKRYVTHVKSYSSKKQLSFCDERIVEGERPHLNIKMAIYKRRPNEKFQPLLRNILSCLEVNVNPIVPLPDFWSLYLKQHHEIPVLVNPFICSHGKIKSNMHMSKMKGGPQRIPPEIYTYLLQVFGGRPIDITNSEDPCLTCHESEKLKAIQQIRVSEKEMAAFADKLSNKKQRVMINREWLQQWKKFVYYQNHKGYRLMGNPRPSSIKNVPDPDRDIHQTHKKISPEVWYFLHKFYSGGPKIPQKGCFPNVVVKTSVNLRLQSLKESFSLLNLQWKSATKYVQTSDRIEEVSEQQHFPDI